jgi:hypothetical protein
VATLKEKDKRKLNIAELFDLARVCPDELDG